MARFYVAALGDGMVARFYVAARGDGGPVLRRGRGDDGPVLRRGRGDRFSIQLASLPQASHSNEAVTIVAIDTVLEVGIGGAERPLTPVTAY